MSSEDAGCTSRSYQNDELVTCELEAPHSSVHIGTVGSHYGSGIRERVQWTDADAIDDTKGVDDNVPDWYRVLPVGEDVRVIARRGLDATDGVLRGCVLDDAEQPAALIVDTVKPTAGARRVLVPWHNVASLGWDVDS